MGKWDKKTSHHKYVIKIHQQKMAVSNSPQIDPSNSPLT